MDMNNRASAEAMLLERALSSLYSSLGASICASFLQPNIATFDRTSASN